MAAANEVAALCRAPGTVGPGPVRGPNPQVGYVAIPAPAPWPRLRWPEPSDEDVLMMIATPSEAG